MKTVSTSLVLPLSSLSHDCFLVQPQNKQPHHWEVVISNASSYRVETNGMKVCGRKELTFSTEQIPSPWEFSFYDFPRGSLWGLNDLLLSKHDGSSGANKDSTVFMELSRRKQGKEFTFQSWGAFLCMPTWWCLTFSTEHVGNQINLQCGCLNELPTASFYVSMPQLPNSNREEGWHFSCQCSSHHWPSFSC